MKARVTIEAVVDLPALPEEEIGEDVEWNINDKQLAWETVEAVLREKDLPWTVTYAEEEVD